MPTTYTMANQMLELIRAKANASLALFTASPNRSGGGTEVSGGGYARQKLNFNAAANGQVVTNAQMQFPQATANWGTITHFGILDAASGGSLLWYDALTSPITINTGSFFIVQAGDLTLAEGA